MNGAVPSRRAIRAAALAALATIGIAGCGHAARAHSAAATVDQRTFIDLVPALPVDLDETGTPDPASAALLPSWSGELVRPAGSAPGAGTVLPPDGAVVPYLATSWTLQPNGDGVFELRRGVRGPTGHPFTATDVRWSLERAIARSPDAPFLFSLAHIDTANPVTILSPYRIRVNVTGPSPFLLSVLAGTDATIYDSQLYRLHATAGDRWAQQWGSTHSGSFAAYTVTEFLPRSEILLTANPGFWRRPYYTHVVIRQLTGSSARLDEVLAGHATHTSTLAWNDFATAVDRPAVDGVSASILQNGPGVLAWHFDVSRGPLANPLVRQALNLGVNRSELASAIADAYASPSVRTIPAIFGQPQPTVFDPVQARSLMRAAGYPHGVTINIATNMGVAGEQVSTVLRYLYLQMLEIDVFIHTIYVDNSDQLLALETHHQVQSSLEVTTPLLGGAAFLLEETANTAIDPVSVAAQERYSNATLTPLLAQLGTSSPGSAATATALQQHVAAIIDTDLPTINLITAPVQNVTRANVTGYRAYTQPTVYYEQLRPTP